jgi:hypothetical protein
MSFTDKRLCNPTQLTTSGQTLYTVPASKTCIIKQIVVTNTTSSAATFSLFIGSAATPNALFSATSVAANDAIIINLSQVLAQNEILTGLASSNSTLNITISGVENDGPLNPVSTYIADSAITTAKLADSSVSTAKIINNSVNQSKLSTNLSGITITTSSLRSTDVPSPFEGQVIYETNTDKILIWNGSAWQYLSTPQTTEIGSWVTYTSWGITQPGSVGSVTKNYSKYTIINKTVIWNAHATMPSGTAGISGNVMVINGLPLAAADASSILGSWYYLESGVRHRAGTVVGASTSTFNLFFDTGGSAFGASYALKANDVLRFTVTWEIA